MILFHLFKNCCPFGIRTRNFKSAEIKMKTKTQKKNHLCCCECVRSINLLWIFPLLIFFIQFSYSVSYNTVSIDMITMITNDKYDKYVHTTFSINMITINIIKYILRICMSSFICCRTIYAHAKWKRHGCSNR